MLLQGDPVPSFTQYCNTDWKHYSFDMAAGRYIILLFCPSIQTETTQIALNNLASLKELRQQARIEVFIVSADRNDRDSCDLRNYEDTAFFLFDADLKVHNLFGVASDQLMWVVVDPMLRVKKILPYNQNSFETVKYFVLNAPPYQDGPIPALLLDSVLEAEFCQTLINYFNQQSPIPSGILTQNAQGKAVTTASRSFKRRYDCILKEPSLVRNLQARIIRRVVPEIKKSFQCEVTGMDRMIVSCYDSADLGCFAPHRDNTVAGARHRLFAISINLNNDFDGGDLFFPEFSARGFCPSPGGAIIFSSALLHAVRPVTAGRRYACLPFVFNEASITYAKEQDAKLSNHQARG
ncbi:redoxin domain-containing protein [Acetobacter indonesiensis]|uniref:Fe2OG dioxygenase domain-containing protein n=1 Tax=Acetobacter indonesiensis TaxID=104101 RepID=A0A6N3T4T5_9PROT|nr:redoxin domain-containing protein [Acetobacter indonesiensis]GAN64499.1 hypothetical protein Abin_081_030 [Acetobacter indonesiensis]GEN04202.1 hypothetical protein AIN02nite_22270 [Acetobacter indonesiensis]